MEEIPILYVKKKSSILFSRQNVEREIIDMGKYKGTKIMKGLCIFLECFAESPPGLLTEEFSARKWSELCVYLWE